MAAVIGDYVSGLSRFHGMVSSTTPIQQHQGQQRSSSHDSSAAIYRSSSRNRPSAVTSVPRPHRHDAAPAPPHTHSSQPQAQPHPPSQPPQPLPRFQPQPPPAAPSSAPFVAASSTSSSSSSPSSLDASSPSQNASRRTSSSTGAASRLPSPPPSSSPAAAPCPPDTEDGKRPAPMASHIGDGASATNRPQASTAHHGAATMVQQPTPPDDSQLTGPAAASAPGSSSGSYLVASSSSSGNSRPRQGNVIHIRDLAHIESLVRADPLDGSGSAAILQDPSPQQVNYEISAMPIDDIIEMVAALLTKITATNDLQHDAMQRNVAHQQQASQNADANGASQMSPLSHSVLAFHGRNVPAITILSYLSRIHKYCPTTYEVFLSLLVYFDRMTEKVNELVMEGEERQSASRPSLSLCAHDARETQGETHGSDESDSDLADDDDEGEERTAEVYIKVEDADAEEDDEEDDDMMDSSHVGRVSGHAATSPSATYFVVDSFNIHRLIIAGVTCASKFFSDVFYTNSRYAKVGGLPLAELNHLEIQFLVLNDFRLAIPVEDLETYATMLVEFYAREVVAPRSRRVAE